MIGIGCTFEIDLQNGPRRNRYGVRLTEFGISERKEQTGLDLAERKLWCLSGQKCKVKVSPKKVTTSQSFSILVLLHNRTNACENITS